MASGPTITATLGLDTKQLQTGLDRAQRSVKTFASEASVAGRASGMLAGLLGGIGVASIATYAKSLVAMAGNLTDTAENLNMSAEALQRWQAVFAAGGVDEAKLTSALEKFNIKLAEARDGSDSARAALARLGISANDLQNLGMDEMLDKAATAAKGYSDSARLAADMQEVFGKGGQRMINVMRQGGDALKEQRAEAVALKDEHRKLLDDAGDDWDRFLSRINKMSATGLAEVVSLFRKGKFSPEATGMLLGVPQPNTAPGASTAPERPKLGAYIGETKDQTDTLNQVNESDRTERQRIHDAETAAMETERDAAFRLLDPLRKVEDLRNRMLRNAVLASRVGGSRKAELLAENAGLREQARELYIASELAGPNGRRASRREAKDVARASAKFERDEAARLRAAERRARTGARLNGDPLMPDRGPAAKTLEQQMTDNLSELKEIKRVLNGKFKMQ